MGREPMPGCGRSRICLPRDYTVVDTETTGLSAGSCGLIEVAALRVRGGQPVEEFSTLVRPPWREVRKKRGVDRRVRGRLYPGAYGHQR